MDNLRYINLDKAISFKRLTEVQRPLLSGLLNKERVENCEISLQLGRGEFLVYNYAAKQIRLEDIDLFQDIADDLQLIQKYRCVLSGAKMNPGENRSVLHHLTRGQFSSDIVQKGQKYRQFYLEQQNRFFQFSENIRNGAIQTPEGKNFENLVQIGIGGSDLGPRALYIALQNYCRVQEDGAKILPAKFISNVDPDNAEEVLSSTDCEKTLFILVSKSGTTQETLTNEALVLEKLKNIGIRNPKKQIISITSANSPLAQNTDYLNSFFIDDYIGGRFSSTSAVGGVVLSLAFGKTIFEEILRGAHAVDEASLNPQIFKNAALLDALFGVYERNVLGYPCTAVLPYSRALSRFPAHLQQLDMESNGKRVNRFGEAINYSTGPIVFGEPGTDGQHSFYQLLHQGSDPVPLQFIGFKKGQSGLDCRFEGSTSQEKLNANLAAQIVAFALGKTDENRNKHFPGERPSSLLYAEQLSPTVLGALLAHYENKIMFQGFIWNINSFDQEGVQLGKILTTELLSGKSTNEALRTFSKKLGISIA